MEFIVADTEQGSRIDQYLAQKSGLSRSRVKQLVEEGNVEVNGATTKPAYIVKLADRIKVVTPPASKSAAAPEALDIDIIYEDADIIVVNKPRGMVTHPAAGNFSGTLVNALLYHCKGLSGIGGVERPGIVHRLDKDTSGLLVVAKNDKAHLSLSKQIKERTAVRKYLALVYGNIKQDEGKIEEPIGRSLRDRKKMAVFGKLKIDNGKLKIKVREAVTYFKVKERYDGYSLVELKLETGRTHQIRLHMTAINHPVVGDKTYGKRRQDFKVSGQLLHAYELEFTHPRTGKRLKFTAPVPAEMERVIKVVASIQSRRIVGTTQPPAAVAAP